MKEFYQMTKEEALSALQASENGLSDAKAQKDQCERVSRFKRARYGDEGAPPKARSSNEC